MKQGDIVLIDFPFSHLRTSKLRPALVLSNSRYNRHANVLVAGIYGRSHPCSLPISSADLELGALRKDSYIGLQNIVSVDHAIVQPRVVATLTSRKLKSVVKELIHYL